MECCKSFDVFDTCLIRLCGAPERIFDIMSERLFKKSQIHLKKAFLAERDRIERFVFKDNPNATIYQLYEAFNVDAFGLSRDELIALEMDVQEEQMYPNRHMLDRVRVARKAGCKIAFISDMYLPSSFIRKILEKNEFFEKGDILAVSCDLNASKYEGSLFDWVLNETRTSAKQWEHCGDNSWSDYEIPRKKGMKAVLYEKGAFSKDEAEWLIEATYSASRLAVEQFSGICRAVRLNVPDRFEYAMAVDFIAAVYIPYVYHVLLESRKRNFKRLYFIGRDGKIFFKIAEQFQSKFPNIELRYIKFSRRAIYPCSFYDADKSELDWFFQYSIGQKLDSVLSYLGFEWDDIPLNFKCKYDKSVVINEKNRLDIQTLFANECGETLKEISSSKRTVFLDYLRQEKLFDGVESAFVDLGWVGTTRVSINKMLEKEGFPPVFVFYFGASKTYMCGSVRDDAFIFQKQFFVNSGLPILLLEHYASMNSDGSVLEYKRENDSIVAKEAKPMFKGNELIQINEKVVISVAEKYVDLNLSESENYDVFLCCGLRKLIQIEERPTLEDYDVISTLQSEDYGVISSFVKRYSLKDFIALLIWGVPATTYWDAGARIKTFGKYHNAFKSFFEFTSSLTISTKLRNWWGRKR